MFLVVLVVRSGNFMMVDGSCDAGPVGDVLIILTITA